MRKMNLRNSKLHEMSTVTQNKVALSGNDDKRHVFPDEINTLALNHYKVKKNVLYKIKMTTNHSAKIILFLMYMI